MDKPVRLRARIDSLTYVRDNLPNPAFNIERVVRGAVSGIGNRTNQESMEKFNLNLPDGIRDLPLHERLRY